MRTEIPLTALGLRARLRREAGRIAGQLACLPEVRMIILHGSVARGDVHASSDIDMIVVGDFQQRFVERAAQLYERIQYDVDLDLLPYTPAEFEMLKTSSGIVKEALREGKVVYER